MKRSKSSLGIGETQSLEVLVHGIFAITMTLLILDLRLPDDAAKGDLWHSLKDLGPQALAYLFGFVYLAANWLGIRDFFRNLRAIDRGSSIMILAAMGLISLTPVTVSVLASAAADGHDLGVAVRLMSAVVGVGYAMTGLAVRRLRRLDLLEDAPIYNASLFKLLMVTSGAPALAFAALAGHHRAGWGRSARACCARSPGTSWTC